MGKTKKNSTQMHNKKIIPLFLSLALFMTVARVEAQERRYSLGFSVGLSYWPSEVFKFMEFYPQQSYELHFQRMNVLVQSIELNTQYNINFQYDFNPRLAIQAEIEHQEADYWVYLSLFPKMGAKAAYPQHQLSWSITSLFFYLVYMAGKSEDKIIHIHSDQNQDKILQYYHKIKNCKKCNLSITRTNFVFGEGNPDADLLFIGEAPGREEDLKGVPFIGKAGQLLTLMLLSIGVKREDVYIANVLKCRPPNNRDPLPEEINQCEPYLIDQIDLISPKLIVALGRFAASSLLRSNATLGELRDVEHKYNDVPLIVTFHPSALLRNPQWKKQAWEDLKRIKKYL